MDKNQSCSVRTKNKMARALKELMETSAFEKITVSDITDKCNIHRQTFYYHFEDRYELLDWLIYNDLLEPFITDFTFDNMYDKFYAMFETLSKDKKFYQKAIKINSADLSCYLNRLAKEEFTVIIRSLGEESEFKPDENVDDTLIAEFFGYGISGVVINWVQRGMKESPEDMTEKIQNLVDVCKKLSIQRQ